MARTSARSVMTRSLASVLLFLTLVAPLAACKKDSGKCEKLVDMAFKCDEDLKSASAEEKKTTKLMMGAMCEEAFRNDTSSVSGESKKLVTEMYEGIRKRAECASKATTCEQYEACETDK
jgi:hypothetical protein